MILSNSCDLDNKREMPVLLCGCWASKVFLDANPGFLQSGKWGHAVGGRMNTICVLPDPIEPSVADNELGSPYLVCDFREIYSLPREYVDLRVNALDESCGLRPEPAKRLAERFAQMLTR